MDQTVPEVDLGISVGPGDSEFQSQRSLSSWLDHQPASSSEPSESDDEEDYPNDELNVEGTSHSNGTDAMDSSSSQGLTPGHGSSDEGSSRSGMEADVDSSDDEEEDEDEDDFLLHSSVPLLSSFSFASSSFSPSSSSSISPQTAKTIWQCLIEQDAVGLSELFSIYLEDDILKDLLSLKVEQCPGEFVARTDYSALQEEGFGDGSGVDSDGLTLDRKWFCYVGVPHGSTQYRTFPAGSTPLHVVVRWSENSWFDRSRSEPIECFQLLLGHGANVHACDSDGQTPLVTLLRGQSPSFLFDDSRVTFLTLVEHLCRHGSFVIAYSKERLVITSVILVGFLKLALLLALDPSADSPLNERLISNALGAVEVLTEHGASFDIESVQRALFPDLHSMEYEDQQTIAEWAKQSKHAAELGVVRRQKRVASLREEMASVSQSKMRPMPRSSENSPPAHEHKSSTSVSTSVAAKGGSRLSSAPAVTTSVMGFASPKSSFSSSLQSPVVRRLRVVSSAATSSSSATTKPAHNRNQIPVSTSASTNTQSTHASSTYGGSDASTLSAAKAFVAEDRALLQVAVEQIQRMNAPPPLLSVIPASVAVRSSTAPSFPNSYHTTSPSLNIVDSSLLSSESAPIKTESLVSEIDPAISQSSSSSSKLNSLPPPPSQAFAKASGRKPLISASSSSKVVPVTGSTKLKPLSSTQNPLTSSSSTTPTLNSKPLPSIAPAPTVSTASSSTLSTSSSLAKLPSRAQSASLLEDLPVYTTSISASILSQQNFKPGTTSVMGLRLEPISGVKSPVLVPLSGKKLDLLPLLPPSVSSKQDTQRLSGRENDSLPPLPVVAVPSSAMENAQGLSARQNNQKLSSRQDINSSSHPMDIITSAPLTRPVSAKSDAISLSARPVKQEIQDISTMQDIDVAPAVAPISRPVSAKSEVTGSLSSRNAAPESSLRSALPASAHSSLSRPLSAKQDTQQVSARKYPDLPMKPLLSSRLVSAKQDAPNTLSAAIALSARNDSLSQTPSNISDIASSGSSLEVSTLQDKDVPVAASSESVGVNLGEPNSQLPTSISSARQNESSSAAPDSTELVAVASSSSPSSGADGHGKARSSSPSESVALASIESADSQQTTTLPAEPHSNSSHHQVSEPEVTTQGSQVEESSSSFHEARVDSSSSSLSSMSEQSSNYYLSSQEDVNSALSSSLSSSSSLPSVETTVVDSSAAVQNSVAETVQSDSSL